jgi:hypothetical protein
MQLEVSISRRSRSVELELKIFSQDASILNEIERPHDCCNQTTAIISKQPMSHNFTKYSDLFLSERHGILDNRLVFHS